MVEIVIGKVYTPEEYVANKIPVATVPPMQKYDGQPWSVEIFLAECRANQVIRNSWKGITEPKEVVVPVVHTSRIPRRLARAGALLGLAAVLGACAATTEDATVEPTANSATQGVTELYKPPTLTIEPTEKARLDNLFATAHMQAALNTARMTVVGEITRTAYARTPEPVTPVPSANLVATATGAPTPETVTSTPTQMPATEAPVPTTATPEAAVPTNTPEPVSTERGSFDSRCADKKYAAVIYGGKEYGDPYSCVPVEGITQWQPDGEKPFTVYSMKIKDGYAMFAYFGMGKYGAPADDVVFIGNIPDTTYSVFFQPKEQYWGSFSIAERRGDPDNFRRCAEGETYRVTQSNDTELPYLAIGPQRRFVDKEGHVTVIQRDRRARLNVYDERYLGNNGGGVIKCEEAEKGSYAAVIYTSKGKKVVYNGTGAVPDGARHVDEIWIDPPEPRKKK
jgi:hypothetical protein